MGLWDCLKGKSSPLFRLPPGALGFLSAAKNDFAGGGVVPVAEMRNAALSGQAVEVAQFPHKPRRGGPNEEKFEVWKMRFPFLNAEKIAGEAVPQDHRGMRAAAAFPHACEDVARRAHGLLRS